MDILGTRANLERSRGRLKRIKLECERPNAQNSLPRLDSTFKKVSLTETWTSEKRFRNPDIIDYESERVFGNKSRKSQWNDIVAVLVYILKNILTLSASKAILMFLQTILIQVAF